MIRFINAFLYNHSSTGNTTLPLIYSLHELLGHAIRFVATDLQTRNYHFKSLWSLLVISSSITLSFSILICTQLLLAKSKSHCDGRSVSKPWCRAPSGAHDQIFITVWQLRPCFCGAPSLTRGRVCLLHMLLVLASTVLLGSESLVTIFYCLRFQTSLFVVSYNSQGHGGGIRPHHDWQWSRWTCPKRDSCNMWDVM
jgi:hypothetical protein